MSEKRKILDVEIDRCSKKEALNQLIAFVEQEPISIVDFVNMDMLSKGQDMPQLREAVRVFDLVLPGDEATCSALGQEERDIALPEFFHYMKKRRRSVFVIGMSVQENDHILEVFREKLPGIVLSGSAVLPDGVEQEDAVINQINETMTDCILAQLRAPSQEAFIIRNYAKLNVKLWLGGENLIGRKERRPSIGRVHNFLKKMVFQRKVEKEKEADTEPL